MNPPHIFRYYLLGAIFGLASFAVIFKMVDIQNSSYAKDLLQNVPETTVQTIYPARGSIYDRWGHLLAGNTQVYEVGIDVSQPGSQDPDIGGIAAQLSSITGADAGNIVSNYINSKNRKLQYAVLVDFVTPQKISTLKDAIDAQSNSRSSGKSKTGVGIEALHWKSHLIRTYPENEVGFNLIGYYPFLSTTQVQTINGKDVEVPASGTYGVEEKYNDYLAGTPRIEQIPNNPLLVQEVPEVPPGSSLILTIDIQIQRAMEQVLDKGLKDSGAQAGTIVVEDPRTGEILAMANTPRLNLNQYWDFGKVFPNPIYFNRSVSVTYEPGSVFKVLTMGGALDAGVVKPETTFDDPGVFHYGGGYIYNWDGGAWGVQTMTGCMEHSLNVCLAWIATQMGATRFYNYIQAFGIGHPTGIDLGNEANYPLRLPGEDLSDRVKNFVKWSDIDLATNAFGQGLAVTPVQMVMAVSAVPNDGKMMAPHILKAMVNNGRQYPTVPQVVGMPISAQTAHTESEMLAVSLEKESSAALIKGYRVAGKTGTAEIPTPYGGYSDTLTNASFVGWGPVDDPRFLVYVWLEKPTASKWGSVVASPVFAEAVQQLVVLMDIPPDSVRLQNKANASNQP
jgi:cell division protein FtsI/penicillin-binding protein 2